MKLRYISVFVCRMNTTIVQITIQNINDNPPVFVNANGIQINQVTVAVEENLPGHSIYQLNVSLTLEHFTSFIGRVHVHMCVLVSSWQVEDRDGTLNELEVSIDGGNMLGYFEIDE